MARECADCRFFNNGEEGALGECRRHAPGTHLVQCGTAAGGIDMIAVWPLIDPEDWCGEYEEHRNGSSEILAGVAAAAERRARERRG